MIIHLLFVGKTIFLGNNRMEIVADLSPFLRKFLRDNLRQIAPEGE